MQTLVDKVRRGGRIGTVVGEPPGARERGLEVHPVRAHPDPKRLAAMVRAVAEGTLVIPIAKRLSLSQIREAQQLAQTGAGGKVIVQM
jgi:NADPH:quinone reductase-like Zn-dependent oxidoreductase